MKTKVKTRIMYAILLSCSLCFFLPDVKAQNGIGGDYHIIIKEADSPLTEKRIFVVINDKEKNIMELTDKELRYAIKFILKCWDKQSKREYERQQELYKKLVQVNGKKQGKK